MKDDEETATEYARDLKSSRPGFAASKFLRNFYFDEEVANELLAHLEEAGWSPS